MASMREQTLLEKLTEAAHAADFGVEVRRSNDGRYVVFVDQTTTFGDILVEADEEELIVTYGRFTHSHFACYREDIGRLERRASVVDNVIETLSLVFSGEIAFYGSHAGGGGCGRRELLDQQTNSRCNTEFIYWPKKIVS
jgi:hypothetical protein